MSAYDILIMNNQSDKMKGIHMKKTKEQHNERKKEIMEKCFECYAENDTFSHASSLSSKEPLQ